MKVKIDKDLEDIIPRYLKNREEDIVKIEVFIRENNIKEIEVIAHKLAGSAGSYGFNDLGTYAREMEQACQNSDMQSVQGILEVMKKYLASIEIEYVELD